MIKHFCFLLFYASNLNIPFYRVISLRIVKVHVMLSFIYNFQFSAEITTGFDIDNPNALGVDIYAVMGDLYYPDWYGELQHIGVLHASNETVKNGGQIQEIKLSKVVVGENVTYSSKIPPISPIFSIKPRVTTVSRSDFISILLKDLSPKIYLNLIKHWIKNGGVVEIIASFVAHVKVPLGGAMSFGIFCNHGVKLYSRKIVNRNCSVSSISVGWDELNSSSLHLRQKTLMMKVIE